ncbi:efflux RND transporter periplasmic adaptor subunit, partial [Actinocorallia lasiicapitis]
RRWQDALGVPETGTVAPDAAVFAPGPVRVGERKKEPGDPASGPVLTYTGQRTQVTMDLPVADQGAVRKGTKVTVTLPDGRTVKGVVSSVGTVAKTGEGQGATTSVPVTVALSGAVRGFDQAPVTVTATTSRKKGVLTVPVAALLAKPGGGYQVAVVEGGARRLVDVDGGTFAQGLVEVAGDGLAEGQNVEVPV